MLATSNPVEAGRVCADRMALPLRNTRTVQQNADLDFPRRTFLTIYRLRSHYAAIAAFRDSFGRGSIAFIPCGAAIGACTIVVVSPAPARAFPRGDPA